MYIRFHKHVQDEWTRQWLKKELEEYLTEKNVSIKNHPDLLRWVASGNSPYDNPNGFSRENGVHCDYLEAQENEVFLYEMLDAMSSEECERYEPTSVDDLHLPF